MKEITIKVPDNCELKQDGNTYTIVEKEKKLTYEDVAGKLFNEKLYYIDSDGSFVKVEKDKGCEFDSELVIEPNNCVSEKQAKKLLAINKLMNVAKYLNGDWQPDWDYRHEKKYYIFVENEQIIVDYMYTINCVCIYFKSKELAKQAIEILGEETIKLALCTDY